MAKDPNYAGGLSSKRSQEENRRILGARRTALSSAAQMEPKFAAQVLEVYKSKDRYYLKYINIQSNLIIDERVINNTDILYYNQFIEAINALRHNWKFIKIASKLNKIHSVHDKSTGETSSFLVDLDYLKSIRFEYDKSISNSIYGKSKSNSVPLDEILFENLLCSILETSIQIINNFETLIDTENLSKKMNNFAEHYEKERLYKEQLIASTRKMIEEIRSGVLSLDALHDEVVKCIATDDLSL